MHSTASSRSALTIGFVVCLAYLAAEIFLISGLGLPLDDSWIHLHLANQLADGAGLTYNPDRWVPASTAPLWTALLAIAFLLPGNEILWAKLLSVVFYLGTVDATRRLSAELGLGGGLQKLTAVMVALTPWLAWSALSGMEITLFSWLSLWGLILHLRERADPQRSPASLAIFGIAVLARPEGLLLLALAGVDRLMLWRREDSGELEIVTSTTAWQRLFEGLVAAAAVVVPTLMLYRLENGSFLPTTYAVKAGDSGLEIGEILPNGRYLRIVLDILFRSQPVLTLLAAAGAVRLASQVGGRRDRGILVALWPIGLALAYAMLAPREGQIVVGNFGRYFFPVLPVVVILGVVALEPAVRSLRHFVHLGGLRLPLRATLLTTLLLPQIWGVGQGALRYARTVANVEDSDVAAARWLAGRIPPDALLAVQDIGAIKALLPNPVYDLAGIINPEILPALRGGDPEPWESRLLRELEHQRPELLVVFPTSYPNLVRTPGFQAIQRFTIPDNMTMAGDELVIFTTPWTRRPPA